MRLIDSHCHLYDEKIIARQDEIIENFSQDNLECVLVPSCDLISMQQSFDLAQRHKNIYSALGLHPHDAKNYNDEIVNFYKTHCSNSKVVAIGEIGLDYYYDLSPRQTQKDVLALQLDIANNAKLPVIFHIRDAYDDFFDVCKGNLIPNARGVMHCFSGDVEIAKKCLDMGFNISFTCNITYKHSEMLREVAKYVPLDRLLIETDSPYMSPNHCRKEPNEPKNVVYVAEQIAIEKGLNIDYVGNQTSENFYNLFTKCKK